MQTNLADFIKDTPAGREADSILRKCVHCGFCTATCPTYQLLGDELDGPRGRIYLIKQALEGEPVTRSTQQHLDRCLTCRSCETTCPSGVRYARLADIGRAVVEERVPRPLRERALRKLLRVVLSRRERFLPILRVAQWLRPLMPSALAKRVPEHHAPGEWPAPKQRTRKVLALRGCVQGAIAPRIDAAAARVLDRLGVTLMVVESTGCCGALSHHLSAHEESTAQMRKNIDAWWPHVEAGAEAIVVTASACAVMVKDYALVLADDANYAEKATHIAAMTKDLSQLVSEQDLSILPSVETSARVAFHAPCTLQHGQGISGKVEGILRGVGFEVAPVRDAHLCCGSAGTYSILQSKLSNRLRENKLARLEAPEPDVIATANIGCLTHLATGTHRPVKHWIELLDDASSSSRPLS